MSVVVQHRKPAVPPIESARVFSRKARCTDAPASLMARVVRPNGCLVEIECKQGTGDYEIVERFNIGAQDALDFATALEAIAREAGDA